MFPPAILLPLLALLKARVWSVTGLLGDRVRKAPSLWAPEGKLIPEPLVILIQAWLQKRRHMIEALMHRIAAGTHVPRPYRRRDPKPDAIPRPRIEVPPEKQLPPRTFGWISLLASEVAPHLAALIWLLNETEMKAAVLASPQMARLWVPLRHALGLPRPDWWPKPPPRPRRPRPPRPRTRKPVLAGLDPAISSQAPLPPPWRSTAEWAPPADTPSTQRPLGVWDNPWVRPSTRRLGEF